uniref:Uncharacterized protein n=1 Tax=Micrurus surinamensis TaxID=129470 RepID=A0A2D4PWW7_MICSU
MTTENTQQGILLLTPPGITVTKRCGWVGLLSSLKEMCHFSHLETQPETLVYGQLALRTVCVKMGEWAIAATEDFIYGSSGVNADRGWEGGSYIPDWPSWE